MSLCQIQDIIRMSHLLTVFRISEEQQGELDVAIILALLKGTWVRCPLEQMQWKESLGFLNGNVLDRV